MSLGFLTCALFLSAFSSVAWAGPPAHGIDLNTVFQIQEYTKTVDEDLKKQEQNLADPTLKAPRQKRSLQSIKTIVIDPGHGGENQGAIGVAEIHEKYLTMELAYAVRDAIRKKYPKARVHLTRYWDKKMGLNERIYMANKLNADIFLSLHYNAAVHPRAVGVETYYLATRKIMPGVSWAKPKPIASTKPIATGVEKPPHKPKHTTHNEDVILMKEDLKRQRINKQSAVLARIVQRNILNQTRAPSRGVKQANFGVLRGALMPAVVVEGGFLSHPEEGKTVLTSKHQRALVKALVRAVEQFDTSMTKMNKKSKAKKK